MKKLLIVLLSLLVSGIGTLYAADNSSNNSRKGVLKMNKKVLIAYFSATGNTKRVAENLAKVTGGDLYEIKPLNTYTNADLDWTNDKSRSSVEMKDLKFRPEMAKDDFSIKEYDEIFLGFPIWWYIAPTIVNTFLEKHDFSNKTIILFATSGGSPFGKTLEHLKPSVSDTTKIIEGDILNHNPDEEKLKAWVETFK